MKVGDLVVRKVKRLPEWSLMPAIEQRLRLGQGLVLSIELMGNPRHECAAVFYPKTGDVHHIATSLMEVVSESR